MTCKATNMTKVERVLKEFTYDGQYAGYCVGPNLVSLLCNKFPYMSVKQIAEFAAKICEARLEDYDEEIEKGL